ncbi:MAG: FAD-dependent oxidoreductase [Syntrophaceae bacterium]|nr:FAD-dependent oxidoreductase [Syntrophaceae bacterium]
MEFIKLFEPISINRLIIRNRIVMPAMALAYTDDYTFKSRYKAFYRERALGGVGLMIIGPIAVDRAGSAPNIPGLFEDRHIAPIREFVSELHKNSNAKLGIQLMHMGRFAPSQRTGLAAMAPSPIPSRLTGLVPRAMSEADIEEVQGSYAQAARRAIDAGFDFIEILAAGGYLIGNFLSPVTNHRTDRYGGSLENRIRFGLEVVQKVREAVGKDFALGIRVSGHDFLEGGHTNIESALFCGEAEKIGTDCINVTGGWHETNIPQISSEVPPGAFLYLARSIKDKIRVPVFASNRLGDPLHAEKAIRSGAADMICWGRPLLADPELPKKVQTGRLDEIVPCISCNQGCFDSLLSGSQVCCTVNPRLGREDETEVKNAEFKKRIFVAGGGPAGMQFALTARQRGHEVILYEKTSEFGGQVNIAASPPGKKDFLNVIKSLKNRMEISGVRFELNRALTPEDIEKGQPDSLVVATGGKPAEFNVPGINHPRVVNAWDVLNGRVPDIGKQVIVVGGGATGCETALYVANLGVPDPEAFTFLVYHSADDFDRIRSLLYEPGRRITIVEIMERFAGNMGPSSRWPLMKKLKLMGIKLRPKTKLDEITQDSVIMDTEAGRESIPADTIILATGTQTADDLVRKIKHDKTEVFTIGDAKKPRDITAAIREGFDLALRV